MAAIHPNDRLLIIDRKLFRDDVTNLFVGVVEEYEEGVVRLRGYSYHINPYEIGTEKRAGERVRVVSVGGGDVIYVLPREMNITQVEVRRSPKSLILSDSQLVTMDLTDYLTRT
jgi:hypothetical protein